MAYTKKLRKPAEGRGVAPARRARKRALKRAVAARPGPKQDWLRLAFLLFEKCDLKESYQAFLKALDEARANKDLRATAEALAGLLRFSGEALDDKKIRYWEQELDGLLDRHPEAIPPLVWYCKGVISTFREEWKVAQRHFHRYLHALRRETPEHRGWKIIDLPKARGLVMFMHTLLQRGHLGRAEWLGLEIIKRVEHLKLKGINGVIYMMIGNIAERRQDPVTALIWYQRAHATFLEEHNWYHHLYVLYGYARLARMRQEYSEARWYLDLIEKAARDPEFGVIKRELVRERARLDQDSVDLLIDGQKGTIKMRATQPVSFKKQYVLLDILKVLSEAHAGLAEAGDEARGVSKGEIIEKVWGQKYRPEAHDNKLYYNINRLRKLIEPDAKHPQILVNWKEGYRLAPGLKVQWVGGKYGRTTEHRKH